jgi:hypothetical protein
VVNAHYSDIDNVGLYNGTYNDLGNNINRNPRLENASANDFHLMSVSPDINAGLCGEWINYGNLYAYNRIAPSTDFEADVRCSGFTTTGCCDIGADESPYSRMASQAMPWIPLLLLDD